MNPNSHLLVNCRHGTCRSTSCTASSYQPIPPRPIKSPPPSLTKTSCWQKKEPTTMLYLVPAHSLNLNPTTKAHLRPPNIPNPSPHPSNPSPGSLPSPKSNLFSKLLTITQPCQHPSITFIPEQGSAARSQVDTPPNQTHPVPTASGLGHGQIKNTPITANATIDASQPPCFHISDPP
ncbi:hypothetical protein DSO57_1020834 [Entomophthora muscae]|uniref:Uncharacterized protein n=1 Tax=Entomophthora muscae TaxID=34485 RepID=A0ACC2UD08_9FUNG|nr:hypothetical protein DSO57_1020834 [Entomophthora muscae]